MLISVPLFLLERQSRHKQFGQIIKTKSNISIYIHKVKISLRKVKVILNTITQIDSQQHSYQIEFVGVEFVIVCINIVAQLTLTILESNSLGSESI